MLYKLLGFIVWRAAVFVLRQRYEKYLPSRKATAAAVVALAVAGLAFGGAKKSGQLKS